LFCFALGKLNLAPIGPNPHNVLDVATGLELAPYVYIGLNFDVSLGTGNWAIDFGEPIL
jgi:hypothetical protein